MKLNFSIDIIIPEKILTDGTIIPIRTIAASEIDLTIIDSDIRKTVQVKINNSPYNLTLWSGSVYDVAGDYTQKHVENRVLELLGDNPNDASIRVSKLFGYVPPASAWSTYQGNMKNLLDFVNSLDVPHIKCMEYYDQ